MKYKKMNRRKNKLISKYGFVPYRDHVKEVLYKSKNRISPQHLKAIREARVKVTGHASFDSNGHIITPHMKQD